MKQKRNAPNPINGTGSNIISTNNRDGSNDPYD